MEVKMNYKEVLNLISFIIGGTVAHFTPNTKQGILIYVCAMLIWGVFMVSLRFFIDNYKIVER